MKYLSLTCGKGVNKDLLPSELSQGGAEAAPWSDVLNVRSRNGFEEAWEGAHQLNTGFPAVPIWVTPYSTGTTRYAVYTTTTAVYAYDGSAWPITRFTDGAVVSSMTAAGTTVTVTTATAHGLSNGNTIYAYGSVPATYNADAVAVTVLSATSFTYTVASAPTSSPATVKGAYSGNAVVNFSGGTTTDRWSGGAYQGVCLLNHPTIGLYYWGGDTSKKMRKMPNWPYTALTVRPFKQFIFILGTREDGTVDPKWVTWSVPAESGAIPTSFVASDDNAAGGVPLETSGSVVDCLPLGDQNIIYTTSSIHTAQYVEGSASVFNFSRLPGSDGLLTRGAVVDTPVGHVYLTTDYDVKVHSGGQSKSIADGRILNYLRNNFDRTKPYAAFLAVNPQKSEVWVCVPIRGVSTIAGRAFVWSWESDTWGIFDLTANANSSSGLNFAAAGQFYTFGTSDLSPSMYLCNSNALNSTYSDLWIAIDTNDGSEGWFNGSVLTCMLERAGLDLGSREVTKSINRSRWNFDYVTSYEPGAITVYHGYQANPSYAPNYSNGSASLALTAQSRWANLRAIYGQFQSIKITFTAASQDNARLRSVDLNFSVGGKR